MVDVEVTIIFSSLNGEKRLRRTLESFCNLHFSNFEIIAVDNNSTDNTSRVISEFSDRLPIKLIHVKAPGKSKALNQALELANGRLIVFTDDDVRAEPDWLEQLVNCANKNTDFGIFGGTIVGEWESNPGKLPFLKWIPLGSTFAITEQVEGGPCDPSQIWGPSTMVRASALGDNRYREDMGPLPSGIFAMGEDSEIVLRLARQGVKTYRCANAVVHHWIPASSVSEEWVQRRAERLGYGMPALFPEQVPSGPKVNSVPLKTWLESLNWGARALIFQYTPRSRLRFWAIWKRNYMRGYRRGVRKYAVAGKQ